MAITDAWIVEHDADNKIKPGAKRGFDLKIEKINSRSYNILNFLKEQKIKMNFTKPLNFLDLTIF